MNCDAVLNLVDPYLDSELDARTALEIRQHLGRCPRCANRFAEAEQFAARLQTRLRQGPDPHPVWQQIEARILAQDTETAPARSSAPRRARADTEPGEPWWRFWLWPSPRCYAGLACVWLVLAWLNPGPETPAMPSAATAALAPAELSVASAQQRRLRAELLELSPEPKPAPRPASPQSHGTPRSGARPA